MRQGKVSLLLFLTSLVVFFFTSLVVVIFLLYFLRRYHQRLILVNDNGGPIVRAIVASVSFFKLGRLAMIRHVPPRNSLENNTGSVKMIRSTGWVLHKFGVNSSFPALSCAMNTIIPSVSPLSLECNLSVEFSQLIDSISWHWRHTNLLIIFNIFLKRSKFQRRVT